MNVPLSGAETHSSVGGEGEGTVQIIQLEEPFVAVHNHPSNDTISYEDLSAFWNNDNFVGAVVIGNNGENTYTLLKTDRFDFIGFAQYYSAQKHGLTARVKEAEFLKGGGEFGVLYVRRNG